jgi:hypothetical protein
MFLIAEFPGCGTAHAKCNPKPGAWFQVGKLSDTIAIREFSRTGSVRNFARLQVALIGVGRSFHAFYFLRFQILTFTGKFGDTLKIFAIVGFQSFQIAR